MKFRVVSAPGRGGDNPYIDLFYDALTPYQIELVGGMQFSEHWFAEHFLEFDAIHLHWPEGLWRSYTFPILEKMKQANYRGAWRLSSGLGKIFRNQIAEESLHWFEETLIYLRKNNKKILWTWHNYEPHESSNNQDIKGQQILAQYADLIIFHSEYAAEKSKESYDIKGKTVLMPHGNYEGVYPEPRDRAAIVSELGLHPDLPIVGMLGNIREYKGVDNAIDACAYLGGEVQFLCAGNPYESFPWSDIVQKALALEYCALVPRRVSDQEFSDYAYASDILLFPYRSVTGSGALLAALTLGKGVIASDLPFFRDVLGGYENAGLLVSPTTPEQLSEAIIQYLQISSKTREDAACDLASRFRWDDVVLDVVLAIEQLR